MSVDKYFNENEYLPSHLKNYIRRSVQEEAARIIDLSLSNFSNTVIEAPTGSGKTMAYLIPVFSSKKKFIISTKTKHLMHQLYNKDIPVVQTFLGSDLSIQLLKGRKNYFCPYRFYRFIIPNSVFYADAVKWYENISETSYPLEAPWGRLDDSVCNLMTADRFQCRVSKCAFFNSCPFYLQKERANNSDIIITNHHLFLSDMGLKVSGVNGGIFDFRDHAIFDEAHSLPDIYTQYAGSELSLYGLNLFFRENREFFSLSDMNKVQSYYADIMNIMTESSVLYENIREYVSSLIEYGGIITEKTQKKEIIEEYQHYISSFEEIESDKEGVRIAERNRMSVVIKFRPVEISESFAEGLKLSVLSSVFISATISADGKFDYFLSEIGLNHDNTTVTAFPPVFNFSSQGRLFVASEKECNNKDNIYFQISENISGSVLIICNSIDRMWHIGEILSSRIKNKKIIFQNNVDLSEINNTEDIILIGCAALREGIDLSGGNFRCVIIDKLPFEYFKDYYLESKKRKIESEGGNYFINFLLPRAVIYFKQAVGRLIRHENDFGVWVILDHRILNKSYGKFFISVLDNVKIVKSFDEIINFINDNI